MQSELVSSEVPTILQGAWERTSIEHADGTRDDSSTVVWIQLASTMADLRVPPGLSDLGARGSLAACTPVDLRRLAKSESSTGHTVCSPIEVDDHGVARATAEWEEIDGDVAFQPVSAYPEAGLLEWSADGGVMIERAPSGAYVEEWRRMPGSDGPLRTEQRSDGSLVYRAGDVVIFVRDRCTPVERTERLDVLVAEAGDDRAALEALVDCEFSLAVAVDGVFGIVASTHPWRVGEVLDVAG